MEKRGVSSRKTPQTARRYTPEFKRDAVALLRSSDRPIKAVARELGVSDVTLAAWAREENRRVTADEQVATEAERREAVQLRKRVKELEQEIEILKRFTAYWVKEGGQ
ncbi:MAG: transposase [Actinomycetota bacterium]|jgi:transposase|nr:transposase [Actinomycetota bacterium]